VIAPNCLPQPSHGTPASSDNGGNVVDGVYEPWEHWLLGPFHRSTSASAVELALSVPSSVCEKLAKSVLGVDREGEREGICWSGLCTFPNLSPEYSSGTSTSNGGHRVHRMRPVAHWLWVAGDECVQSTGIAAIHITPSLITHHPTHPIPHRTPHPCSSTPLGVL
jgi:hypothetical protein